MAPRATCSTTSGRGIIDRRNIQKPLPVYASPAPVGTVPTIAVRMPPMLGLGHPRNHHRCEIAATPSQPQKHLILRPSRLTPESETRHLHCPRQRHQPGTGCQPCRRLAAKQLSYSRLNHAVYPSPAIRTVCLGFNSSPRPIRSLLFSILVQSGPVEDNPHLIRPLVSSLAHCGISQVWYLPCRLSFLLDAIFGTTLRIGPSERD